MFQVTKLDRDPSSGTALQEISFWLNLERALLKIQDKRESLEVSLTLDVLKHGKRFHATVSFDTDTGKFLLLIGMAVWRGDQRGNSGGLAGYIIIGKSDEWQKWEHGDEKGIEVVYDFTDTWGISQAFLQHYYYV